MLRPHWEGFWGRKGSLGAQNREHPGGGWGGQEQGAWAHAVGGRETERGAGYRATRPLQYLLGLIIASLEEGEKPTHVESRCSEAV